MKAPYEAEVAAYLADCALFSALLNPKYHPTEDGAVKMIAHKPGRSKDKALSEEREEQVRAAYRAARGGDGRTV